MNTIKVLIVDDSLLFRDVLQKGLKQYEDIEVIGAAADPFEAKDQIIALRPDVVTLDVEMPRMDGIKFLRKLMPQFPVPVIIISSLKESVFEAMDAGAIDFISKPDLQGEGIPAFLGEVAEKIRIASSARRAFHRSVKEDITLDVEGVRGQVDPGNVIAIGASTGGTEAIFSVLTKFSDNMPGIVIVQHMPSGFTKLYAERLDAECNLEVLEAKSGDEIIPGRVLIAPGDYQMRIVRSGCGYAVFCDQSPKVNGHRPSVDVLFESAADVVGQKALGIILTGMGADGAKGLKKIREVGGYTIGQDERSCVVYGMPMAAYVSGAVMVQLPLYRIPDEICRKLSSINK
ncbi:MAG: chemotaxis response regulator protein-glutamate methylesterase [Clostridiales Family XIII bacterium]|jgi:two-component system chemotaxis response regulator CheB|nr:chemotaxis response regulator protein-glutamate methylesterase [Clostridiales Family XIII bacterium]